MYCTVADIQQEIPAKELAQITNDGDGSTIDVSVVETAIVEATALIDTYLITRYPLPLSEVPIAIRAYCRKLVKVELFRRRPKGRDPEELRLIRREVIMELEKLQAGTTTLDVGTPETRPGFYVSNKRTPVFDTTSW